ncbi:MAG: T9SS type A sorting domain-containing protein [Lewinellaceae bacterium]|jgi:ELWxxDGT repeat protein|nr:T9SS type A sorting domain-containing protein [Lewinellaceae bacterium]
MRISCFTLQLMIITTAVSAQQPVIIHDLNPTTHAFPEGAFSSKPVEIIPFAGKLIFAADDGSHGSELWISDGTPSGTLLLKDINPGTSGSSISGFIDFNGLLYFAANNGADGKELWVSDGTGAGTHLLKDLRPGSGNSNPRNMAIAGGHLFFAATKSNGNPALWQTDGTESGTIETDPGLSFSLSPGQLTELGGKLYFTGPDMELWVTDGSPGGTSRVKEISPSSSNSYITQMTALNGKLYFSAADEVSNKEPWVSDGTEAGTFKLKEIDPDPLYGSDPWKFHLFKDKVYFSANSTLWRTDGTLAGTAQFKNITVFMASNDPASFISDDMYLYFPANDGINGFELWRSDGTPVGTVMLKNINAGSLSSAPEELTLGGDSALYFRAYTGNSDWELWKSDGSGPGTIRLADIRPGMEGSYPQAFTFLDGELFFIADDGIHGRELWKLNTTTGTNALVWSTALCKVLPNPAHDFLQISITQPNREADRITLLNAAGSIVYESTEMIKGVHTIPVTALPAGMYVAQIIAGTYIQCIKVMIL